MTSQDLASYVKRVRATGATFVRISLNWGSVAPAMQSELAAPTDPNDLSYRWGPVDAAVSAASDAGLTPILDVEGAPSWAQQPALAGDSKGGGTRRPDAALLGQFATAAASRYGGVTTGLPRVRYWQVWNEPNLSSNLVPQYHGTKPVSPDLYRALVNAVADSVKAVHSDNLVIAGGTAPFRDITPSVISRNRDWGPLTFMRQLLCLSKTLQPTCRSPIRFDIWGHHPYTSGGPSHHASLPDDVSLGDLAKMRAVLDAASRSGEIQSSGKVAFWVDEFGWDSNPPDPAAVPISLLKRWVPEALYRMWANGVTLGTWFLLDDQLITTSFNQTGLYFSTLKSRDSTKLVRRAKPIREGFRFPVVAYPRSRGFYVWGRTPGGTPGRVAIEQRTGVRWSRVRVLVSNSHGIFQQVLAGSTRGFVRGRLLGTNEASLAFSLASVADRSFNPFGSTGPKATPKRS
jgi:hypothetical protein